MKENFVMDCELLDMLVTNIWYQLTQIIIYYPLFHGYNCLCY